MYGFTGLYGQSYGITIQQSRSIAPQISPLKSNITMQQQIGARPGFRTREADAGGCWTEYVRQADGTFTIARGPRYVGMRIAPGGAAAFDWQRLDAKYRADDRTVPPGRWCDVEVSDRPPTDDEPNEEPPEDPGFPWQAVTGGLVVAGVVAGAYFLLRRKK